MRRLMMLSALALAATAPAFAQTLPAPPPLPDGQTLLNVSATEHMDVQQDLLTASLRIEKQGADAKAVQNDINTLMAQGAAKAKAVQNIQVSTGQYYVYPVDMPEDRAKGQQASRKWQGSQSIQIKGMDAPALLTLAGELQGMGMVMDGLTYSLSPDKAEEARDSMMERALAKAKAKAERAGKALGKSKVELVEVTVDASNQAVPVRPMMAMAAMDKSAPEQPPTAEPGQEQIDLTVSAQALLKP